jgi:hypothetical protein
MSIVIMVAQEVGAGKRWAVADRHADSPLFMEGGVPKAQVCLWPKADIEVAPRDVRFRG